MQPSPHGIESETFTPVRMGCQGAVVANHPLAAVAGMGILMDGGNAVDAAVAIGFALGAEAAPPEARNGMIQFLVERPSELLAGLLDIKTEVFLRS